MRNQFTTKPPIHELAEYAQEILERMTDPVTESETAAVNDFLAINGFDDAPKLLGRVKGVFPDWLSKLKDAVEAPDSNVVAIPIRKEF